MAGKLSKKADAQAVAAPYEPTRREKAAIEALHERDRARAPSPSLKVEKKGKGVSIEPDHPDPPTGGSLLMAAIGASELEFVRPFLMQLVNAGSKGPEADQEESNFMLSVVKGIEPRDQIEAMLAAQMAAVHMATMTFARRLNHVDNIPQQDSAERAFNKLTRTFATQIEALKRYRTGGQQKVVVEHVTVNAGGQAIVGAVQAGGGGAE
jgi:hypothetical protein